MKYKITILLVLLFNLFYGQVTFTTVPSDKQLVGRDLITNKGNIIIEGEVDNSVNNYNSIEVEVYRDNVLYSTDSETLNFTSNIASFDFNFEIDAELVNYSIKIYSETGGSLTLEEEIFEIVAGDAYIILGQSNAAARKWTGNNSANGFMDNFIRVYASGTSNPSTLITTSGWYFGQGDSKQNVIGNTGQWGLKLANAIVNNTNIPVAIFNGADDGKAISFFQAPVDYQSSLSSNYGRLYYRINETGLKNFVRGFLWSHGPKDADNNETTIYYKNAFNTLKSSLLNDYPNIERFYIFQTRNQCQKPVDNLMKIKEAQRQLAFEDPIISIMPTSAMALNPDNCHFLFTGGYTLYADRIFPVINRDLYGVTTSSEIDPPMIIDAYMQNSTTLIVETDATTLQMNNFSQLNEFELSNAGASTITNIGVSQNKIVFTLSSDPGPAAEISYVGPPETITGDFISNSNNLELVCFNKYPVGIISTIADGNWNNPATWPYGVPLATQNVTIDNNVTIAGNASATINNITLGTGSLTINSGGSLIVNGSSSGDITYKRDLPTTNWYLISSPLAGQDVDDFVIASNLQTGSGNNIGLGTYNTSDDTWSYYQNGTSNANTFNSGQGYVVNLLSGSGGEISFSGAINENNLTIPLTTSGSGFNLLGNMYTSYIDSGALLSASSDALLTETLWIWDQSANGGAGGYVTKVKVDAFQLAPGQGFFVQSDGSLGNVTINESFQSHQGTDTFIRASNRPEVYLTLSSGVNSRETKLYYIEGATTGFDNGYDGPMFGGTSNSFAIYTHTIANDMEKDLAIQSLPNNDYENLIVPIGINANSGSEITISANSINLPSGIDLFLEDKSTNTFTLLNAYSDFTTTINSDISGVGRFYLHTTSSVLGVNNDPIGYDLHIYSTSNPKELIVKGQLTRNTKAELFDLQGRLLFSEILDKNLTENSINISNINTGIFVLKVSNENQSKTQKIIIK